MKVLLIALATVGIVVLLGAATAGVVWFAWDSIAVAIFGAPALTFWQAWLAIIALGFVGRLMRGGSKD